jgi:hypothetical protein
MEKTCSSKVIAVQLTKTFLIFYESQISLPSLQEFIILPYPQPDESSPYPATYFFMIHFNTIIPSMTTSRSSLAPSLQAY